MFKAMSEGIETELAESSGSLCTVEPPQVAAVTSLHKTQIEEGGGGGHCNI